MAQVLVLEHLRRQELALRTDPLQTTAYDDAKSWWINYPEGCPSDRMTLADFDHALEPGNLNYRSYQTFFEGDQDILGRHFPLGIEDPAAIKRWLGAVSITTTGGSKHAAFLRFPDKVPCAGKSRSPFVTEHITFDFAFTGDAPFIKDAHLTSNAVAPKSWEPAVRLTPPGIPSVLFLASWIAPLPAFEALPLVARWSMLGSIAHKPDSKLMATQAHKKNLLHRANAEKFLGSQLYGWIAPPDGIASLVGKQFKDQVLSQRQTGLLLALCLMPEVDELQASLDAIIGALAADHGVAAQASPRCWTARTPPFPGHSDWRLVLAYAFVGSKHTVYPAGLRIY